MLVQLACSLTQGRDAYRLMAPSARMRAVLAPRHDDARGDPEPDTYVGEDGSFVGVDDTSLRIIQLA